MISFVCLLEGGPLDAAPGFDNYERTATRFSQRKERKPPFSISQ